MRDLKRKEKLEMQHVKIICTTCKATLLNQLFPDTVLNHVELAPCQTCLDQARKAAGEAGQLQGYDQAIAEQVEHETPEFEATEEELINQNGPELEDFNSARARGVR
jgi:hypothetical protein